MKTFVAVVLGALLPACGTTPVLYSVDTSDDGLSIVDPATGTSTFIGTLDPAGLGPGGGRYSTPSSMAVRALDGALFVWNNSGSTGTTDHVLAIVDRCTGAAALVAPTTNPPQDQIGALAFDHQGRLFGFGRHGYTASGYYALYEIDPATGVQRVIGRVDTVPSSSSNGLSVFGADFGPDGKLYGFYSQFTVATGDQQKLVVVDPSTASARLIGVLDMNVGTPGSLVFDPSGKLLGSAFNGPPGRVLFELDPLSAAVSNVRPLGTPTGGLGFSHGRDACSGSPSPAWRTVSGTVDHMCALASDDRAYCWGRVPMVGERNIPTLVTPMTAGVDPTFESIRAAGTHTCGLSMGSAYCWGTNYYGQLGNGTTTDSAAPVRVNALQPVASVFAGGEHACVLDVTGQTYCWGRNVDGELGDGTTAANRTTPVAVTPPAGAGSFRQLALGYFHTCGITTSDDAYCWGNNEWGQLGDGSGNPGQRRNAPTAVAGGHKFMMLSGGMFHTCGVTLAGETLCWGSDYDGGLGYLPPETSCGYYRCSRIPRPVSGGIRFQTVSAGANHTCGITASGLLYCWGPTYGGQLGNGYEATTLCNAGPCSYSPLPVFGGRVFRNLSAAQGATCAVDTSGAAYCWGAQPFMLGAGPLVTQSFVPIPITSP